MRLNKRSGFTLLEIIIVVLILAVLASIAMPTFTNMVRTSRENAAQNSAKNYCQQLGAAWTMAGSAPAVIPSIALTIAEYDTVTCSEAAQVITCTANKKANAPAGYATPQATCTWAN